MPYKDPEKQKAYNKEYYAKHPEWRTKYSENWRKKHPEEAKEALRAYRKRNPEKVKEWQKQQRRRYKWEVLSHYSSGTPICACCGETFFEFLTIDHINNDGAEHRKELKRIGHRDIFRWLRKNKFPKGFRVLCMNCNWAEGLFGFCPHNEPDKSWHPNCDSPLAKNNEHLI